MQLWKKKKRKERENKRMKKKDYLNSKVKIIANP